MSDKRAAVGILLITLVLNGWWMKWRSLQKKFISIALSVPGVINCHDIASRGLVGRQVFIEMHLIVDARICKHCSPDR